MMLCLDVSHRVLLKTTVLDHIRLLFRGNQAEFKSNALKSLLGKCYILRFFFLYLHYINSLHTILNVSFKMAN